MKITLAVCSLFFLAGGAYFLYKKLFSGLKTILNKIRFRLAKLDALEEKLTTVLYDVRKGDKQAYQDLPFPYLETQYAQTVSEQLHLFQSLVKETAHQAQDELILLNQLIPGEQYKFLSQDSLTIIGTLPTEKYQCILSDNFLIKNVINPLQLCDDKRLNLFELHRLITPGQDLLILNPHVASMLFLYPSMLKLISPKVARKFVFPCYIQKYLFQIEWNEQTFRPEETNGEHYWRWAVDRTAHLYVINNSPTTKSLNFLSNIWLLNNFAPLRLEIYFLNDCFKYVVKNNSSIEFQLDVPPGRHRLSFCMDHAGVKEEGWVQTLYFALANLQLCLGNTNDAPVTLSQSEVYGHEARLSLHSDELIRNTLHGSGFFEISATAFSKNNPRSQQLPITRFHLLDKSYQHLLAVNSSESFYPDNIWYFAKRTATLREK